MRKLISVVVITLLLFSIFNLATSSYQSFSKLNQVTNNYGDLKSLQLKNNDLKKQLSERQSDFYLEKQARDKLNYGKSGETLIVLQESDFETNKSDQEQKEISNTEKWLKLLKISL